jgi:hypothetical protein
MSLAVLGIVLIGITVAMVLAARPADGTSAPFLRSWPFGQAYALVAMASSVAGTALVIANWPF